MALSYVTLICDLGDGQGNYLVTGTGSFVPTNNLTDATDHLIAAARPRPPRAATSASLVRPFSDVGIRKAVTFEPAMLRLDDDVDDALVDAVDGERVAYGTALGPGAGQ